MKHMLLTGLALVALGAAPARLAGQAPSTRLIAPGHDALATAAELRMAPARPSEMAQLTGATIKSRRSGKRQGEILMIVGAAGLVTGLLVDEDIITIAGAGVAGFGLYLYLQDTR